MKKIFVITILMVLAVTIANAQTTLKKVYDETIDPSSTYQLVNALIKANKEFELVIIPGADHTMGEDYGEHKRYDFFVKNLLGVDPPKWNLINSK